LTHQALVSDTGFDNPTGHRAVASHEYRVHIRRIRKEKLDPGEAERYSARRWVDKHTLAWQSKCRAILGQYDKKASKYIGLFQ
jgi:hypothetical protein